MKRITLSETGIKNLAEFDWIKYFKYNNANLLKLDFNLTGELTREELAIISPSIRAFQIGEGSEGKHLRMAVKKFADRTHDLEYDEIMKWFILEENRHSQTLKKYMDIYGIKTANRIWIDTIFRALRKLMGLECEVTVLVTAEMIALSYYTALSNATQSKLLKTICAQMLNDELKHVVLQSHTLHKISKHRKSMLNRIARTLRNVIMKITCFVVWHKYKTLFITGQYPYQRFRTDCLAYLNESIYIERNGTILEETKLEEKRKI